jgi:hypothetical protein
MHAFITACRFPSIGSPEVILYIPQATHRVNTPGNTLFPYFDIVFCQETRDAVQ